MSVVGSTKSTSSVPASRNERVAVSNVRKSEAPPKTVSKPPARIQVDKRA